MGRQIKTSQPEKSSLLPEVFVSNDKKKTVLQNNVFWRHLISRAVGKIHTAAQSQLK